MTGWFDITPGSEVVAEAAAASAALREPEPTRAVPNLDLAPPDPLAEPPPTT